MTRHEGPFQFFQLPTVEVGPAPSPLVAALIRFPVATFLLVLFLSMISSMMQMMYTRMMPSDRRYQGMIAQRRMWMMRMMMTEKSDRRGSGLMLSLHSLLDLALHLT